MIFEIIYCAIPSIHPNEIPAFAGMKYTILKVNVETHTQDGICAYALPDGEPCAGVNGKFSELSKKNR